MDMALDAADSKGFEARRAAVAQARQTARLRLLQHHRALGRGRPRRRRDQVRSHRLGVDLFRQHQSGPGPRDRVQADRLRPARPRSQRSAPTSRATPTRCSSPKAPAARARRRFPARPSRWPPTRSRPRPRRSPPQMLKVDVGRHQIRRRRVLEPEDQPDADHQGSRQGLARPEEPAGRHGAGPDREGDLSPARPRAIPNGVPRLRARDRRGDRRRRDRRLQRGRRRRHRDQSAVAARPDRRRHRHGRRPDPDGRHQVRRARARS